MNIDDERFVELKRCIAKHCEPISNDNSSLLGFVFTFHKNLNEAQHVVARYYDAICLEELERHLRASLTKLSELSDFSQRKLQRKLSLLNKDVDQTAEEPRSVDNENLHKDLAEQSCNLLGSREAAISALLDCVTSLRKSIIARRPAVGNLNPESTAVAITCIEVWRKVYGDEKTPTTINSKLQSPLGRFIEDVFFALNIDHDPVSAFNAAKKLKFSDPFVVSIEGLE